MKKSLVLAVLLFGFVGCTPETTQEYIGLAIDIIQAKPTFLKVVNELEEDFYSINSVMMDEYEFKNLNIKQGDSKEFRLKDGLPLETDGIEVIVTFSSSTRTLIEKGIIDLYPGGTTIIWLTGREGCSGCGGHRIEWGWED